MPAEPLLEQLSDRLERVLQILAEGRGALGLAEAHQWKALALARWEMLRALAEFSHLKQVRILDPLIEGGNPTVSSEAAILKERCRQLSNTYNTFVQRWDLKGPLSVHPAYQQEAVTMGARIESEIVREVQEIEVLLRSVTAATLAAGVTSDIRR